MCKASRSPPPEGNNEPPLQRIIDALGIPLDVGGSDLPLDTKAPAILAGSAKKSDAHQCLFPPWTEGTSTATFDPGKVPFSLVAETGHGAIPLDPKHSATKVTHPARVFPVHTFLGTPVTDAIILLENVRPASTSH